jgi:hypothetical protein
VPQPWLPYQAHEDCNLLKCYLKGEYELANGREPNEPAGDKEKEGAFPNPKGFLMIFGGLMAYESRRKQRRRSPLS